MTGGVSGWLLVAVELGDLEFLGAPYRMATVRDYVSRPGIFLRDASKIINLARSYEYQRSGYYASLLAEARGHRVIPTVETILDLATREGYARAIPELEDVLNRELSKASGERPKRLLVCFGKVDRPACAGFGRLLFDWYRAPAIVCTLSTVETSGGIWTRITRLSLCPAWKLGTKESAFFAETLEAHTRRAWRSIKQRVAARYSIAVLFDPADPMPPSSERTLKHWAKMAEKQGVEVEPIQKRDLARLAEFDALFIRETTTIRNHTYRFAQRARAEGMPVIDDPVSMIRCTNKVYLWERLTQAGLPTPQTLVIRPDSPREEVGDVLGFPLVIKIPDGSFSRGVKLVANQDELKLLTTGFFKGNDLLLAQKFVPTTFDWRIGVLDDQPLFACQYRMARGHWQIINHRPDGKAEEGGFKTVPLDQAPPEIVDIAVRSAGLIGNGFYGVDLKETSDGPVVIEINDNPNLDHGVEDLKGGAEIWLRLTRWFTDRLAS
ncbi:MAG: glutathione synthase/RimK-type ligase-like ATP-grasp enzyme [Rhodothermales bacterium]|jgi:glutathione synthase/RimK-type ligase-like ATP-grasp enzyme